ncbi:exonuclease domain-containing protein [Nocardioides sp. InS609-2]|uniref:exonuclease domain-containing protein n=1 Tax=Nocardioides sp. InS609-2 TaxID=2760705 RepID=UPI0020C02420|nr:exonuclease domain-containing protein [Nocardioides sp. InS609-2]
MTAVKWHEGPMVALDTETTGIDPFEARIVTAAIVHTRPGQRPTTIQWLIDPGTDIPQEASDVHGWTTDRLRERLRGRDALRLTGRNEMPLSRKGAISEIAAQAWTAMEAEAPLVVHNAAYDLTLLETELGRQSLQPLSDRRGGIRGVIDPMVLEKQFDVFRKSCYKAPGCDADAKLHECGGCRGGRVQCGGCGVTDRTLTSLCKHYGVVLPGAHSADADAIAAIRLAGKLAAAWPDTARLKLATLHKHQVTWRAEQSDGLRDFWKRKRDERWREVDSGWPLNSRATTSERGAA